jgi:hypothetical protein
LDTNVLQIFDPKYEGKETTSFGITNIGKKNRVVKRNETVYLLPGEWEKNNLVPEVKIYEAKIESLALAFYAYKDSIHSDNRKKNAQASRELAYHKLMDSVNEKESRKKENQEWLAVLVEY